MDKITIKDFCSTGLDGKQSKQWLNEKEALRRLARLYNLGIISDFQLRMTFVEKDYNKIKNYARNSLGTIN